VRERIGQRTGREGGGGTDGAAAMAEADAEGREQDGAQELQAPAAARAQAHLGSDIRILARCSARLLCEFGEGEWLAISSLRAEGTRIFLYNNKKTRYRLIACKLGKSTNDSFTCQVGMIIAYRLQARPQI
jgi:hypothetical protein